MLSSKRKHAVFAIFRSLFCLYISTNFATFAKYFCKKKFTFTFDKILNFAD